MNTPSIRSDITRDAMLFGMWCGFIAAGLVCILLLLVFGPDSVNVFFRG